MSKTKAVSTYQQYLPAILQEDVFVGQFLLAFERILSGLSAEEGSEGRETKSEPQIIIGERQDIPGLEEIIENIHQYFIPKKAPKEFLPWLAGWVALSLRDDWSDDLKREFIQRVVGHYPKRGTREELKDILKIYFDYALLDKITKVEVNDQFDKYPNYFQVTIILAEPEQEKLLRQQKKAKAIIELEKPAWTKYSLKILVPTMKITVIDEKKAQERIFVLNISEIKDQINLEEQEELILAATVTVTPNNDHIDLRNKIILRFKDEVSDFHLFTPEISIQADNQISYRTRYDKHILQTLDQIAVKITNLNQGLISGKITVVARTSGKHTKDDQEVKILENDFKLEPLPIKNILQIRQKGEFSQETIPTFLGTSN